MSEYRNARVSLLLYLRMCYVDASEDMRNVQVGALLDRFVGWTGDYLDVVSPR